MNKYQYQYQPGYLAAKPNPYVPSEKVVMYDTHDARMHVGLPYAVVCNAHRETTGARTIPEARDFLDHPDKFCRECQISRDVKQDVQEQARISRIIERRQERDKSWW